MSSFTFFDQAFLAATQVVSGDATDPIPDTANLYWYYNANTGMFLTTVGGTVATTGQTVGAIETRGSSGIDATQATSTARATLSSINSQPSLNYDGGDFYQVGAVSNWNFLHDSTGFTAVIVMQKATSSPGTLQALIDTCGFSSANRGISIAYDGRSGSGFTDAVRVFISGGGGSSNRIVAGDANNVLTGTTPYIIVARWDGGSGNITCRVNGVQQINLAPSTTATSGNSFYPLNVGRLGANTSFLSGQLPLVALFNNDLTLAEVEAIENYWMEQYGI